MAGLKKIWERDIPRDILKGERGKEAAFIAKKRKEQQRIAKEERNTLRMKEKEERAIARQEKEKRMAELRREAWENLQGTPEWEATKGIIFSDGEKQGSLIEAEYDRLIEEKGLVKEDYKWQIEDDELYYSLQYFGESVVDVVKDFGEKTGKFIHDTFDEVLYRYDPEYAMGELEDVVQDMDEGWRKNLAEIMVRDGDIYTVHQLEEKMKEIDAFVQNTSLEELNEFLTTDDRYSGTWEKQYAESLDGKAANLDEALALMTEHEKWRENNPERAQQEDVKAVIKYIDERLRTDILSDREVEELETHLKGFMEAYERGEERIAQMEARERGGEPAVEMEQERREEPAVEVKQNQEKTKELTAEMEQQKGRENHDLEQKQEPAREYEHGQVQEQGREKEKELSAKDRQEQAKKVRDESFARWNSEFEASLAEYKAAMDAAAARFEERVKAARERELQEHVCER